VLALSAALNAPVEGAWFGYLGCEGEMAKIRMWAVIGAKGVGKSVTIGHLMGEFGRGENGLKPPSNSGVKEIPLRGGGYLDVLGRRQSLQEAGKPPQEFATRIEAMSRRNDQSNPNIVSQYFNILFALRSDRKNNLPLAEEYLSYLLKRSWHLEKIVLLSPGSREERVFRRFGVPICYIYESNDRDVSDLVGQVRNHFGWA
jgi:hypothetical protein